MDSRRRKFLAIGSQTALMVLGSGAARPQSESSAEARLSAAVQAYDSQGDHRTATAGDIAAAKWLAAQAREAGATVALESFELSRVDPVACYLRAGDRHVDGVPLFDAGFTDELGITGRLGPLGSDAEIGLTESEPSRLTDPGSESRRAVLTEVRQSRHKAVVLITRGSRPGLFLLNAPAFMKPLGPPTLQVSSTETNWLREAARLGSDVTLVAKVDRTLAQASNVVARVAGSDTALAPIVVSTPRTAWWTCTGERAGGLACWLEAVRVLATQKPKRDCLFVAFSGHEIAWLGMQDYLRRRPDLVKRARVWLHFGANLGVPRQPSMINASDDALENWAATAMQRQELPVSRKAKRGSTPFGEAAFVHRGGGRYVALVCDNELFHNPADRWPDAIDVVTLAKYARAFSSAVTQMAVASGTV